MMKQTATLTVLKRTIIVFGLCIIPNTSPIFAQSNSNQATTLLEIQALRQEVAELRDMVERQQYQMRKLQSELQSSAKKPVSLSANTAVSQTQSNAVSNITNSNTPSATVPSNAAQTSTPLNYQSSTGRLSIPTQGSVETTVRNSASNTVNRANSNLGSVTQTNTPIRSASAPNGAIDASSIPGVPRLSNNQNIPTSVVPSSTVGQPVRATGNVTNGVSREAERVFSTTRVDPRVNAAQSNLPTSSLPRASLPVTNLPATGIKPVETIQPTGSLSLANSGQTQQGLANQVGNLNAISENDYYQQGFGFLKESKHDEAVTIFQKQIKEYPQGDLADDAYYWIAESLYVTRKLDVSKENFRAILQSYPKSERAPDAMLKLAYIEQEQGNILESRMLLQEVVQFHPQSDAALSAKNRLSEIN